MFTAKVCLAPPHPLPVLVMPKDGLLLLASIHDLMNRARVLDAQLPSHGPGLLQLLLWGQENVTI
jgi:hypothetical protein